MITTVLFGGSFDPIHTGHAMVANYVSQLPGIDEVWLMPGRINPLKQEMPPAENKCRLEMCAIVAARCHRVQVSDVEFNLPEPSYTWNTLSRLRENFPEREFVLLVGSDNWLSFNLWKNHEEILANFKLLVYPRPGYELTPESLPENVTLLCDAPQALISSTFIRNGLKKGNNMNFFVPQEVLKYIKSHHLYE